MTALLLVCAGTAAGGGACVALVLRARRRRRVELRLLSGREKLLGEEIERRMRALASWRAEDIEAQRRAVMRSVDHLHTALTQRQAHLLDWGELLALQDQRLAASCAELEAAPARPAPPASEREAAAQAPPATAPGRPRSKLESELLGRIGELQAQDTPPPRKRPPR